jgi:hypothetical protein
MSPTQLSEAWSSGSADLLRPHVSNALEQGFINRFPVGAVGSSVSRWFVGLRRSPGGGRNCASSNHDTAGTLHCFPVAAFALLRFQDDLYVTAALGVTDRGDT